MKVSLSALFLLVQAGSIPSQAVAFSMPWRGGAATSSTVGRSTTSSSSSLPLNAFGGGISSSNSSSSSSSSDTSDCRGTSAGAGPLAKKVSTVPLSPTDAHQLAHQDMDSTTMDWDWKSLAERAFTPDDQRPIVLFDGVCNLCDATINFIMDQDQDAQLRFCSLQSKTGQALWVQAGRSPTDMNQIVLVTPSKTYFSSEAVSRICQKLDPLPLKMLGKAGRWTPRALREPIYHFVSKRRHVFGRKESCRIDFDGTFTNRFVSDPLEIAQV